MRHLLRLLILLPLIASAETTEHQISAAVEAMLKQKVSRYAQQIEATRYTINLSLPPGLNRLSLCGQAPLVTLVNPNRNPLGTVSTKVSCKHSETWNLLVKADIAIYLPVVVSAIPLSRNQLIGPADIQLKELDIASLSQGYFSSTQEILGLKLTRSLSTDKVLTRRLVKADELVKKGDKVIIVAGSSGFQVTMPGVALEKGEMHEQINVKNLSSGKVVIGRVVSRGKVEADY